MTTSTPTLTSPVIGNGLREGYAEVGEATLHYVEAGEGPLVLLLHGFPEFWYGWRQQIEPLVEAGFRVVAPDLRGYNLSSKPASASSRPTSAATTSRRSPTASRTTPPTSWPPTSAASSTSSAPSPRWSSVTTGADRSPGRWR
jgi:pimeloyl-ACP methyl ester carboxylesterase